MVDRRYVRGFFVFLVLFTGAMDVISTLWDRRVLALETNPLYLIGGGIGLLVLVKMIVLIFIGYMYYAEKRITFQYFYTMILVIVIVAQALAAINNFIIVEEAKEMSDEQITASAMPKDEAIREYARGRTYDMLLPIVLCMLTFLVWRLSY